MGVNLHLKIVGVGVWEAIGIAVTTQTAVKILWGRVIEISYV